MYPGLQHYVYKLLHLQQGEMWVPMSSCPVGKEEEEEAGMSGAQEWGCWDRWDWSLAEETLAGRDNRSCGLACDRLFLAGRGVLICFISEPSLLA